MKSLAIGLLLASSLAIGQVGAPPANTAQAIPAPPDESPEFLGPELLSTTEFKRLQSIVDGYVKSDSRGDDGRHSLFLMTSSMSHWFESLDEEWDSHMSGRWTDWEKYSPGSTLQPLCAAMHLQAAAWRARGRGFSSSVTAEGRQLFAERSQQAWKLLMANKDRSSSLPTWYELAINVGDDAGIPAETLEGLFNEGIRRHPGYHPIYFRYVRQFSPRWGGDWKTADAFIVDQSKAKTNKEGDVLYTRLYWLVDQYSGQTQEFFGESLVNWPRMRRGFEQLMAAYPRGARNHASFAAFACRAGDATTYAKLRQKLDAGQFREVAPHNVTIEVCDARFTRET